MAIFMATVGVLITALIAGVGLATLAMGLSEPEKRDRLVLTMLGIWVSVVGVVGAVGFMILFQKALAAM